MKHFVLGADWEGERIKNSQKGTVVAIYQKQQGPLSLCHSVPLSLSALGSAHVFSVGYLKRARQRVSYGQVWGPTVLSTGASSALKGPLQAYFDLKSERACYSSCLLLIPHSLLSLASSGRRKELGKMRAIRDGVSPALPWERLQQGWAQVLPSKACLHFRVLLSFIFSSCLR